MSKTESYGNGLIVCGSKLAIAMWPISVYHLFCHPQTKLWGCG